WPLSKQKLEAAHALVKRELDLGHLEESLSPWNAPIFVIPKKEPGKFRLLHDLRAINAVMRPFGPLQPGLPIPSAIPVHWPIVILDIKDCFFSIPLAQQDRERFAFTLPAINLGSPVRRYQWTVLPQGMKNSPTICQRAVHLALEPLRAQLSEALIYHYMDDLLLAAPTLGQVNKIEHAVIQQLNQEGLYIQETKVQRGSQSRYLGLIVSPLKVTVAPIKLSPEIKTLHDVQVLVGALQWVRPIVGLPTSTLVPFYELL
ncbi:hypothetical protein N335_05507, partial [Phaethon lepturus]